jgi:hypothetical protein
MAALTDPQISLTLNGSGIYNQAVVPLREAQTGTITYTYPSAPYTLVLLADRKHRFIHLLNYNDHEIFPYVPITQTSHYVYNVLYFSSPINLNIRDRKDYDKLETTIKFAIRNKLATANPSQIKFYVTEHPELFFDIAISYIEPLSNPNIRVKTLLKQCENDKIGLCQERNFYRVLAYYRLTDDFIKIDALSNEEIVELIDSIDIVIAAINDARSVFQQVEARKPLFDFDDIYSWVAPLFPYDTAIKRVLDTTRTCPEPEIKCSLYSLILLKFVSATTHDLDYSLIEIISNWHHIVNSLSQNDILILAKIVFSNDFNTPSSILEEGDQVDIVRTIVETLDDEHFTLLYQTFFNNIPKYQGNRRAMAMQSNLFKLLINLGVANIEIKKSIDEYVMAGGVRF